MSYEFADTSTPFRLLAEASAEVAATSKRNDKIARLADLFVAVDPSEVEIVVGLMLGEQRQGRIGIGWATVGGLELEASASPQLSVADVDQMLEQVGSIAGAGSVARRAQVLREVLSRATEQEMRFIEQVLVGDVRQGALAGVISDAVATAAGVKKPVMRRATMLRGDLAATAAIALSEGQSGLEAITVDVLRPIEPMLAATSETVADAVAEVGEASVEWKLDGARIQVHRDGDIVRVFTRNLNDITDRLPGVVSVVQSFGTERLVLDGEVLGLDIDGTPLAFQDTASAVGQEQLVDERSAGRSLRPFFFDLIVEGDDALIDMPLRDRRQRLAALVGEHGIPSIVTTDAGAAQRHMDESIAAGHEGVMVKAIDGVYEAGRRGKGWRKVKPVHTIDLLVLAAEWGHGRRQGWLSNLHLGAIDPASGQPVMVGKTFKGMTDETLAWQTSALLEREVRRSASGHTVYVTPDLVVEIAVDGAQRSTRYSGGVALRFARLRGYRHDRTASSADSIDVVRNLLK